MFRDRGWRLRGGRDSVGFGGFGRLGKRLEVRGFCVALKQGLRFLVEGAGG